ncbi:sensor domain-containing diguanylate cyclase [Rubellimicrobium rubrum]|uniref:diguanylate cyclase n=1 Tax=Rubellimicrobium rubrum TaxID=2585369 RepID=A0A5C4MG37_9RHOB|nr:sensor domain-containing diguanylate cyclase [Rubellimicrobium rubrum]TNC42853.1 sensor domain-containing diguanylate cyclase [Rubellimicrobium rubrum]
MTHLATPKLSDEAGRLAALYRYEILDADPETDFEDIVRVVKAVFGVPMVAITLIDTDRQWLKAKTGLGVSQTPRSIAFCDHTIRSTMPLSIEDATQDPRFAANPLVTGEPGIRCYLGVPLTTPDGYNLGSLCILGTEPRRFTPTNKEVLREFGRLVMSKMELRMLARRDALTAALSRRAFEEHMGVVVRNPITSRLPMSLLMIDIDRFKHVNDRFGHPVGDLVLQAVAEAIRSSLRPADRLGRLGGEEFGILLGDIDPGTAYALAVRITRQVDALSLPALQGQTVSVSCGVAHWQEHGQGDAMSWIAAADAALYRAKNSGRNRVEVAGSPTSGHQTRPTVPPPSLSALSRFSADEVARRLRDSHGGFRPRA